MSGRACLNQVTEILAFWEKNEAKSHPLQSDLRKKNHDSLVLFLEFYSFLRVTNVPFGHWRLAYEMGK